MKAFTANYFDLSKADLKEVADSLLNHPHMLAYAQAHGVAVQDAIKSTMDAWQRGDITPVHDTTGAIIGFK